MMDAEQHQLAGLLCCKPCKDFSKYFPTKREVCGPLDCVPSIAFGLHIAALNMARDLVSGGPVMQNFVWQVQPCIMSRGNMK